MFNGIWLVASEPLTVGSREYAEGERFEISRTQSGALLVMGRACIAPKVPTAPVTEPTRRRRRRTPPDEPPVESASVDDAYPVVGDGLAPTDEVRPKRRYQRRDLEAE